MSRSLLRHILDEDPDNDDDSSSDDEFHYPQSSYQETTGSASRSSSATDYFSRPGVSRVPADLTPQLTQAPEFRVPTHEAPQKVSTSRWNSPTPRQLHAQWERDESVSQCRECRRRFNFLNRRVCLSFCNVGCSITKFEFTFSM